METTVKTPKQAIEEALVYEKRIRDLYKTAAAKADDATAKKVYGALGDDEQRHVDYLEHRLEQLRNTGEFTVDDVPTAIPAPSTFERLVKQVEGELGREDRKDEKQMLSKALQVEVETSAFYRRMTEQMSGKTANMFAKFLKIEDAHIVAVQAELDFLSDNGFWFDFQEFDMEY